MVNEIAQRRAISKDPARQRIMDSLGGIPLGRPNRGGCRTGRIPSIGPSFVHHRKRVRHRWRDNSDGVKRLPRKLRSRCKVHKAAYKLISRRDSLPPEAVA